jgi:hypothetical protein
MAKIVVRTIGMSIAIEGLDPSAGLDPAGLLRTLAAVHGEAVAPVGCPVEIILIDRAALPWPEVLATVDQWIQAAGWEPGEWSQSQGGCGRAAQMELVATRPER